jgi:hypothetical protein
VTGELNDDVFGALNDGSGRRWAVALAATMAFMVAGGFLGCIGSAQAGGDPDNNVGSPGRDGESVSCFAYGFSHDDPPICNVVGGDGEDGAPGAVYR